MRVEEGVNCGFKGVDIGLMRMKGGLRREWS